ncbi:MAG: hypothetical protein ACI9OJ_005421, partial [Myxococcota bacterium]
MNGLTHPTVGRALLLGVITLVTATFFIRSYDGARLDAHTEVYVAQGHALVHEFSAPAPGPRIGPLPGYAGPAGLVPYGVNALLGGSASTLLGLKALSIGLALGLLAATVAMLVPGSAGVTAFMWLGLGLGVLLDAESVSLRPTSFLALPIALVLFAAVRCCRASERGGDIRVARRWLVLCAGFTAFCGSVHLVAGATLAAFAVALGAFVRRFWRSDRRQTAVTVCLAGAVGAVIATPLALGIWQGLSADISALANRPSVGLGDRISFALHVVSPRRAGILGSAVAWISAVASATGLTLLTIRVARRRAPAAAVAV